MSTPSNPTPQSPEEIRREMKSRFDAVNTAADIGRQSRRDAGDLAVSEENRRWVRPEDGSSPNEDKADPDQPGTNDTPGG